MDVDGPAGVTIPGTHKGNDTASPSRSYAATSPSTKRSYCPSPQPDVAQDGMIEVKPVKATRARLYDGDCRSGPDVDPQSFNPALGLLASASQDLKDRLDTFGVPGTPPELSVQPGEFKGAFPTALASAGSSSRDRDMRNSPEYLTAVAERQVRQFDELEFATGTLLAKLCSQHWLSEYNTLKRSMAAAAAGVPVPPLPTPQVEQEGVSSGTTVFASSAHIESVTQKVPATKSGQTQVPPALGTDLLSDPLHLSDLIFLQPSTAATSTATSPRDLPSTGLTPRAARVALSPLVSLPHVPVPLPPPGNGPSHSAVAVEHTLNTVSVVPAAPTAAPSPSTAASDAVSPTPEFVSAPQASGMFLADGSAVKTSLSHPINISPLIPADAMAHIAEGVFAARSPVERVSGVTDTFVVSVPAPDSVFQIMSDPFASTYSSPTSTEGSRPPTLGNFVLSSCPGKKVRMNGEASRCGRGAICRDVTLDLRRARDEHGVGLVICCLDDVELEFLGVPWPDYAAAADLLELEVVRMPMLEGFAPESPERLDADLAHIVRDYTLRGRSVLAHCRGGIGRAGLVASCWMLKMGLVPTISPREAHLAPVSSEPSSTVALSDDGPPDSDADAAEADSVEPLQVLSRVIELIRRRRNIKAIETPHQVHFLHQYISYLQARARPIAAQELLASRPDRA
ncbi:hypothetical protein JCM3774_006010 [Rhodotorula dairenensis]